MSIRRRRLHRRKPTVAELNITAFMNLMVILVPFLLITAVFSRLAIIQLTLPDASAKPQEQLQEEVTFDLQVLIDNSGLTVIEPLSAFEKQLPITAIGDTDLNDYDFEELATVIESFKAKNPTQKRIRLLFNENTEYDIVLRVTETVRAKSVIRDGELKFAELFPNVSMGTLPVKQANTEAEQ